MDVVRITQALRQQQQNPGRLNTTRTGGSSLVAASAGPSTTGETLHINTAHASIDNGVQTTPCSSPTPSSAGGNGGSGGVGGPISPSSSFFSSLAHFLPGSAGVAAAATVAGAAGSSNVGEIESLLLRSMPMFGNLVSRD
ncbi:hypothetical protein EC957_009959 [Mortierella hygrophila]|uniref:Uncharacterized protein n=1 Tax=Mortierella hygrophila TaxID=979708 RepID=A0A9P6FAG6_9FUNG|nr:hypothetical protein EC957_009959 [Mortierella hygrophila]